MPSTSPIATPSPDPAATSLSRDGGRLGGMRRAARSLVSGSAHPRAALVSSLGLLALGLVMAVVPVPYVIEQPGPAVDILGEYEGEKILTIEGRETFPTDGELMLTTVAVNGGPGYSVRALDVMHAWFDRTQAVLPREALYPPGQTKAETTLQNTVQMGSSQQAAVAVALEELGIPYTEVVEVAGLQEGAPAEGVLEPGDAILSVGGQSASDTAGYQALVAATPPGQGVEMRIRRGAGELDVSVPTELVDGTPRMGVVLAPGYDFPFEIDLAVGGIGGPSAGTMFALSVYDELTPGALTGGQAIAGTGTIQEDGAVGPIGGIRQKMVGAEREGAEYFLAPGANCEEVTGHIPDGLTVLRVDTFDEALLAVQTVGEGGDVAALPRCEG